MGAGSAFECSQGLAVPKQETNSGAKAVNYSMNDLCSNTNNNNNNNNYNTSASVGSPIMEGVPDQFPVGLRVLVVDDDPTCLKILEKMLQNCQYEVTTCSRATVALSLLRERKDGFDLVISDVYMPDMDGFKLLEQVGLEMDLPVIMMSADGETSVVMKGISHGACDYLLKPVRIEALKNIWQHVIRKKRNESKELEQSGSVEDSDRHRKGSEDVEYASSVNEGNNSSWKHSKKRKEAKEEEDEGEQENDDSSTLKKPRVVWSVELHQQFVCAVNQLGIDKAVPKRILELMNVQGLTRENVASHLQKYRLYLRRLSGVGQQQSGLTSSFGGSMEPNFGPSLDRSDLQVLTASGQISRHALAAIQGGLLGRGSSNNGGIPSVGPGFLLQPELKGLNSNQIDRSTFGQPFGSSQNLLQGMPTSLDIKQLPKSNQHISSFGNVGLPMDDSSSGIPMMHSQLPAAGVGQLSGLNNGGGLNFDNNSLMVQMLQHPLHHQHQMPTSTGMQHHSLHHRQHQMNSSTGQQQQHHSVHQHQQQMQTNAGQLQQRSGAQFQGEQLEGVQFQNMASSKLLRQQQQQMLLNDTGGISNPSPLATVGNSCTVLGSQPVGNSNSGQVNSTPIHGLSLPPARSSPAIGHTTSADYQNNYLPLVSANNYSRASTVGLSTQITSMGACTESSAPGAGLSDIVNSQTLRSSNSSFDTFRGIGQSFSQSTRQGWQAQNSSQNLGLNQSRNVVANSCYSPSLSATQSLNAPGMQDKGQVRSYISGEKVTSLSNRFHVEQSVDNELNVKDDGSSSLMANTKFEGGALPEHFISDDLMTYLLKQQQEGLGSGDAEFSTDGY